MKGRIGNEREDKEVVCVCNRLKSLKNYHNRSFSVLLIEIELHRINTVIKKYLGICFITLLSVVQRTI